MEIIARESLPLGGFAGLTEHRLVTDSRVFAHRKPSNTFEGLGRFVYLADARFNAFGETGMHPHHEIDVISVMVEGEVSHKGSLEHGAILREGNIQVQRAGQEGFSHNEVNPNGKQNRMIQLWALPDQQGEPAGYKQYVPLKNGVTKIYGGAKDQKDTFDSSTSIDVVNVMPGSTYEYDGEVMMYVVSGSINAIDESGDQYVKLEEGHLIRAKYLSFSSDSSAYCIVIS